MSISKAEYLIKLCKTKGYYISKDGNMFGPKGPIKVSIKNGFKIFCIREPKGKTHQIQLHRLQAYNKFGNEIFNLDKVVKFKDGSRTNIEINNIELANKNSTLDLYNDEGLKKCITCGEFKLITEFGIKSKNKVDGLNNQCKLCKREYDNRFHITREGEVKKIKYIKSKDLNKRNAEYIFEYLQDKACLKCGESNSVVLEFHHLGNKKFNIGNYGGKSIQTLKKEIEKCQILCANCHRIVTAEERGYYRVLFEK